MISRWRRMSRILEVPENHPWWTSHAQMPTVTKVDDARWRICLAGRDDQNRSNIIVADVDPTRDMAVLSVSETRPLAFGGPGAVDRDGIGVTCAIHHEGQHLWVGGGMNVRDHEQYRITSFWLSSPDQGQSFVRLDAPPLLAPGPENPLGAGIASILKVGDAWHMWFTSMRPWRSTHGGPSEPTYDIRHAVSDDLMHWSQDQDPAIALDAPREAGIVRPTVLQAAKGFEMWYSVRGPANPGAPHSRDYRIGYATSSDAMHWQRHDKDMRFENPPQDGDWDSDMQCYPNVVAHNGRRYLFYSGNGFGRSGIGYAVDAT